MRTFRSLARLQIRLRLMSSWRKSVRSCAVSDELDGRSCDLRTARSSARGQPGNSTWSVAWREERCVDKWSSVVGLGKRALCVAKVTRLDHVGYNINIEEPHQLNSNPSPSAGAFVSTCSGILKVSCDINGTDHLLHDAFVHRFAQRACATSRRVHSDFHAIRKHCTLVLRTKLTYQWYA